MRVLIDITPARRAPWSGPGVYVDRVCQALAARPDVELITAENPRRSAPGRGALNSARSLAGELWWTHQELPRRARQTRAELIHHPLPARIPREPGIPQVLTVHDLAFERQPRAFDRRFRTFAHHVHRSAAQSAQAVIAVSRTTADDLRELWAIPSDRIVVAHHGRGQAFGGERGATGRSTAERRGRYFLYVGREGSPKDLATLLNAYSRYRLAAGERPAELLLAGSARGVAAPGVRRQPDPDSTRLAQLYAGALALVHPARYEGFGLTVLEAMALRVPVVAARSPAVLEVAGEAVLLVDPGDPVGFGQALLRVAREPALRARLSARGRERASGFSWTRSAQRHVDAYALALGPA